MTTTNNANSNFDLTFLILVTARKGSVRLPGKHLLEIGGKAVIDNTLSSVEKISNIYDVLISTDDPVIIEKAIHLGLSAPFTRPAELAGIESSIFDVIQHALNYQNHSFGKTYDAVVLLQGSSPFRTTDNIIAAIRAFQDSDADSLTSVSLAQKHPYWYWLIENNLLHPFFGFEKMTLIKEEVPKAVLENGSVYIFKSELIYDKNPYGIKCQPIFFSEYESTDIDTEEDFQLAKIRWERHV